MPFVEIPPNSIYTRRVPSIPRISKMRPPRPMQPAVLPVQPKRITFVPE